MLAATGVAGDPGSFFHRDTAEGWADALGLEPPADRHALLRAVVDAVIAKDRGHTDLFGMRLQAHSRDRFTSALNELYPDLPGDAARIQHVFGRTAFLYLKRESVLERAVSYLRVRQSGLWHLAADGTPMDRNAPEIDAGYDAVAIRAQIEIFERYDRDWEIWFADNAIAPARLSYDALAANPNAVLARVLKALKRDSGIAASVQPGTRKLADATSKTWIARYRSR